MITTAYPLRCRNPECVVYGGIVTGASAAIGAEVAGLGWTVTYNSTGKYTLTFENTVTELISIVPALGAVDTDNVKGFTVHFEVFTSNQTVDIEVYNASNALADIPAACYLSFIAIVQNSNLPAK